jgi:hypothetical protein
MVLRAACCVFGDRSVGLAGRRTVVLASLFALVAATVSPSAHADAQGKNRRGAIYFQVIDTSVNPLVGAEIVLPHLGLAVQLADEGSLLLVDVPNGMYLVQARHLGYKAEWQLVRVTGDTARAHFILMPSPHGLDTVSVIADAAPLETRLREFLRRSTSSPSGYFLTREDVERRRPADVGALLQTVSGVVVQRAMPGPTFVRSRRSSDSRCSSGMLVFVDGMLLNSPSASGLRQRLAREDSLALRRPGARGSTSSGTATGGRAARRGTGSAVGSQVIGADPLPSVDANVAVSTSSLFDLNQVLLSTIAGIEVYPSIFGVPPEYRVPGAECGVVLIWTAGH